MAAKRHLLKTSPSPATVERWALELRSSIERHFSKRTAVSGTLSSIPSAGHCAAVALIVRGLTGSDMVSTNFQGESHWFNRFSTTAGSIDIDLTGDQYGRPPVQIAQVGSLYGLGRIRQLEEIDSETAERAMLLATIAGIQLPEEFVSHLAELKFYRKAMDFKPDS